MSKWAGWTNQLQGSNQTEPDPTKSDPLKWHLAGCMLKCMKKKDKKKKKVTLPMWAAHGTPTIVGPTTRFTTSCAS